MKTYYLFNPGRLSRHDNTLCFTPQDEKGVVGPAKHIPIENVTDIFIFGSLDANSALYNFLGKHHVSVHFFDYYEHYCGSFMAKEYLQAGALQVSQTQHYTGKKKRLLIARRLVEGAAFNITKTLRYYANRDKPVQGAIEQIERYAALLPTATSVPEIMGLEGNIRQTYYGAWDALLPPDLPFHLRTRQPPQNEVNALISLGNMLCYAACLSQIYHTQLNPTVSFLHQPGTRRFSLALDLAEIFKPILVDRLIFRMLNKRELQPKDFRREVAGVLLKDEPRKAFVRAFEERLAETIQHRTLNRSVSYKQLIRLECYKLTKHVMGIDEYQPFKAWW